ncbi:MAG: sulfatase-like hydrolase/transferase [Treponema sp.]|nr:sulfatase-like hydrolase/transferase [Treponema sp.]
MNSSPEKNRPNIIVFMTDHQRGATLLPDSPVKTPNFDRFMKNAVLFNNAFCPAPHCCPCRATFWSGLYPSEHGVWNNVNTGNALSFGLFDNVRLFPIELKQQGYEMYFAGKWHVSAEQGPQDFGFKLILHDDKYAKHVNEPFTGKWKLYQGGRPIDRGDEVRTPGRIVRPGYPVHFQYGIDEDPKGDRAVIDACCLKLDSIDKNKPFFMFAGPEGPHDPYSVPQKFLDMYDINGIELPPNFNDKMNDKPALYRRTKARFSQLTVQEQKESLRHYYAFCTFEDELFGRLVNKVHEKGLDDNTIIMYLSDHGDYTGTHGLWTKGLPCFREAYNICAAIGGKPVVSPNRIVSDNITLADFAPTILDLAGISSGCKYSGNSLLPYLKNTQPEKTQTEVYTQTNGNEIYGIQRSVSTRKWKYVFNAFDFDELYDLENDPHELKNLLYGIDDYTKCEYSEVVRQMCVKLWKFAYEHRDNIVNNYIVTALAPYGPGVIF